MIRKYDRSGPRYTSYPTAPTWSEDFGTQSYADRLKVTGDAVARGEQRPLSLYFHIPFCRERCWFCGCNVIISRKYKVVEPYLRHLSDEVRRVRQTLGTPDPVLQLHLGGGTPTYLEPDELSLLLEVVRENFEIADGAELSIEVDPSVTTQEHLVRLRELGFNRLSMGVQDLDDRVQETINRVQPADLTEDFYRRCREVGFGSVNMDLIYGLPYQTEESFSRTLRTVLSWRPDRVAMYSYAHVPWLKSHQEKMPAEAIPDPETKFSIYTMAIRSFLEGGYEMVGLDHFARPEDELTRAQRERKLRRNFMGYTTKPETDVLAFGTSAISEVGDAYAQNESHLMKYYRMLDDGNFATVKGIQLSPEDRLRRRVIMDLMCNGSVDKRSIEDSFEIDFDTHFSSELLELEPFEKDGLVQLAADGIDITDLGRLLVRNVAMVFDAYLRPPGSEDGPLFSRTI